MGAKKAIEIKFIQLCNAKDSYFDTCFWERRDGGASFELRVDENQWAEVFATWDQLVDLISDDQKLETFLRAELADGEEHDDQDDAEDPFSTGELMFDEDGRVHFRSDIPEL